MKKAILFPLAVIMIAMIVAFAWRTPANTIEFSVTSAEPIEFDMILITDDGGVRQRGLMTPYEFTVETSDGYFVFVPKDENVQIQVDARNDKGFEVMGRYSTVFIEAEGVALGTYSIR